MKKYLVISAVGQDRPGIVNDLSRAVLDGGCNVEDSRMTVLGGEFALILMISGSWNAIGKIEAMMPALSKKLGLAVVTRPTEERALRPGLVPYAVDVVSMDHPGIVNKVANFFSARGVNIEDLNSWTYPAAHTGTQMFSLNMTISVPADLHIGRLRDEFTDFCDELNVDATLEPARA
ncbi:MAG: glycine cleavage system transcriptional repressor [Acidiferrobacterales bacterium]